MRHIALAEIGAVETDNKPPIDWANLDTQQLAQMDTQDSSNDPGWNEMWNKHMELEEELMDLMK